MNSKSKKALAAALLAASAAAGAYYLARNGDAPLVHLAGKGRQTAMGWPAAVTDIAGGFADPFGVVLDKDGNAYVADAGDHNLIRRIGAGGALSTLAGRAEGLADGPGEAASFNTPSGLAFDPQGNLIVADTGNNAIRRISMQGVVSTLAGSGAPGYLDANGRQARFNGPVGVAVDKAGNVYVADTYNDRIRKISPAGDVSTVAGGAAPGFADGPAGAALFDTPTGLALDAKGNLFIADTQNGAVRRLGSDGQVTTVARSDDAADDPLLRRPLSLAVTADGFLYIGDMARGRILQLSPGGELRGLTGIGIDIEVGDAGPLRFGRPAGIALDRDGALVVADGSRRVLRRVAPRGAAAAVPAPPPATVLEAEPAGTSFPWPLAPQDRPHEVVGIMGEVRGSYEGESRHHFHNGLDVQGAMGAPVLAVADEKVASPLPNGAYGDLGEAIGVDRFAYVHMRVGRTLKNEAVDPARFTLLADGAGKPYRVRVKRGTRFRTGDTLGTVNRMYHVHLIHRTPQGEANPLALPFPGLRDTLAPRIDRIELHDQAGQPLLKKQGRRLLVARSGGPLAIVAEAWDQSDGIAARRKLGLYKLGYQVLGADGKALPGYEQPLMNIEFNRLPPDQESVQLAYAEKSGITVYGSAATRFLYAVTNRVRDGAAARGAWDPAALPAGDYVIRIYAADYAGNEAAGGRDLAVTLE